MANFQTRKTCSEAYVKKTSPYTHDCKLCKQCQESIRVELNKCSACQFIFFKKLYLDFSSGNKVVDEMIKNPIYIPPNNEDKDDSGSLNYYEWITWEHLSKIHEIGRGGFGIIYKATLIDGLIDKSTIKHDSKLEYRRGRTNKLKKKIDEVAIKFIKNSEEVFKELNNQRVMFINNGGHLGYLSLIYGITQNPETLEYGIVMEFAKHGDMRKHLATNFHSTSWEYKLSIAWNIAKGLDDIHSSGMVHRDLHSGNILQYYVDRVNIGDLGLCQLTNNEITTEKATEEKKGIFGVIPYIPPEVLRGEKFTMAGDIYSFSMLLWELATAKPPFYDRPHDNALIFNIVFKGIRPEITFPFIPPCIAEIIEKCWDANPENRPNAKEIEEKLIELRKMYRRYKIKSRKKKFSDEVVRIEEEPKVECLQFLESDKYVEDMLKNDSIIKTSTKITTTTTTTTTTTGIHPGTVYTSRLLTLQMIDFSKELVYLPE
ncbi:hypothetical protein G9A89_009633, partial [Geosiphon pyriformis]